MGNFISQIIISLQGFFPVYLLYKFVVNKEDKIYITVLTFLIVWFLLLKYWVIKFEPFSLMDIIVWGVYNIGLYLLWIIHNEKTRWSK